MTQPSPSADYDIKPRTPLEKAVGLAMWVPGIAWLSSMMGTMMLAQRFLPPDRLEWLNRLYTRGQLVAAGARVRYEVHPDVDPARTYMFAQNHVNLLDHCTLYNATPHFKQGIELAAHFDLPIYGWFMKQRGTIAVDRDGSPRETLRSLKRQIAREVERGHSILVFPEGTRTLDGTVGPFQAGVLKVGHSLGLPIVPVAVTGMFDVLRKKEPYIVPGGDVTVFVEAPVETRGVSPRDFLALVNRVRDTIVARVEAHYRATRPSEASGRTARHTDVS